ncbi:snapalysin [Streptomyces buecherae]|uniref:snapalysin n=1 Tax=Streptomyces buecherae TaxID=2763006 RepID=UPI00164DA6E5|nr:snapalysin [Streptomyces buecherae]MBC3986761.1 snapalysin [Streptomyces buecherae]MBC3988607.1 snapalysin [Streptomyces buecherae]QNJ43784.1 snapalysin [Streptomyces buecherae]
MQRSRIFLTASLGLGLATAVATLPATASASPAKAESQVSTAASIAAYEGSGEDRAATKAFFEAVMKSAKAKQAKTGAAAVTVTYSARRAPTFASQIARSTQIWNSAVRNVQLREGSGSYDFEYREGNDPRGSYASTNGHGRGYIFLDYRQNQQYDSTRVTSHETGHVLGLPDHYSGPCSELMSGGGPGPSCRNPNPNAQESARVNQLWANGLTAFDKGSFLKAAR